MTRRIKGIIEYDGTDYSGWQRQPDAPSVQETLEGALEKLLRKSLRVTAAGRTDAGVHALGQVISFLTESPLPCRNILRGANSFLPPSIRLVKVEEAEENFHPRRDAVLRWYRYLILNRSAAPVWAGRFITHVPGNLEESILKEATSLFLGTHDFAGFRSTDCEARRTRLTIQWFKVSREGALIRFDVACRSFLQNMVRILVGGIIEAARGKISPDVLSEMLESGKRDPRVPTAPAKGLTLMRVYYPGDPMDDLSGPSWQLF